MSVQGMLQNASSKITQSSKLHADVSVFKPPNSKESGGHNQVSNLLGRSDSTCCGAHLLAQDRRYQLVAESELSWIEPLLSEAKSHQEFASLQLRGSQEVTARLENSPSRNGFGSHRDRLVHCSLRSSMSTAANAGVARLELEISLGVKTDQRHHAP